jgi:hypothetical protein
MKDPLKYAVEEAFIVIFFYNDPDTYGQIRYRIFGSNGTIWAISGEDDKFFTFRGRNYQMDDDFFMDYGVPVDNCDEAQLRGTKFTQACEMGEFEIDFFTTPQLIGDKS